MINCKYLYIILSLGSGIISILICLVIKYCLEKFHNKTILYLNKEYADIINKIPTILISFNASSEYTITNITNNINQFGYNAKKILKNKQSFFDFFPETYKNILIKKLNTNNYLSLDIEIKSTTSIKNYAKLTIWPKFDKKNKLYCFQSIIEDITSALNTSKENEIFETILKILNTNNTSTNQMHTILLILKQFTDLQSIAIRLKEKNDYTYYMTENFPKHFLEKEHFLLDNNNKLICLCGAVLNENIDKTMPYFTTNGSFWTTNTEKIKLETLKSLNINLRGTCIKEGYKTIALIPLKINNQIIGLLQINDKRKNILTENIITFLEKVAESLAIAVTRKRLENEIIISAKKAKKANILKTYFLANMSHEIRTPMNSILGFSDLLAQTEINQKQKRYIDNIISGGEHLLALIDNIIDYSKIESEKIELVSTDFNLKLLIEECIQLLKIKINPDNILLYYEIDNNIPTLLKGDIMRIKQIIINLLNNSIKFTKKGSICIKADLDKNINNIEKKAYINFQVIDTGIGIRKNDIKNIFNPFVQKIRTDNNFFKSSGLGLAICKSFINFMGGNIHAHSVINKETIFSFDLKLEISNNSDLIKTQKLEFNEKINTIIVDLNKESRNALKRYCLDLGIEIKKEFDTINDIKDYLISSKLLPDFALIDTKFGIDTIKEILNFIQSKKIQLKLIAITTPFTLERLKKNSIDNFFIEIINKPIIEKELYHKINNILFPEKKLKQTKILSKKNTINIFSGKKILIIEDNKRNRESLTFLLEELGCIVYTASNGIIGLKILINNNEFDLCLMDIKLPYINGIKITKYIRENFHKKIPIIGLTASVLQENIDNALNAGMNDIITKPFNLKILKNKLIPFLK